MPKLVLEKLKSRLGRIKETILGKWQHYLHVFKEGFISGMLSNIITFIINTFLTTFRKFVRVIREGFFAIVRAIQLIVNRPPDMTKAMAYDIALKLVTTSASTTLGIMGVETIKASLSLNMPFAGLIADVIGGLHNR